MDTEYFYYRQVIYTASAWVSGFFRHGDFQLLPLAVRPQLPKVFAWRPCLLELRIVHPGAIELPHHHEADGRAPLDPYISARLTAAREARKLLRVLSVLCYQQFFNYEHLEGAWITPLPEPAGEDAPASVAPASSWCQIGYSDSFCTRQDQCFTEPDCPPIEREAPESYFSRKHYLFPYEDAVVSPTLEKDLDTWLNLPDDAASAFIHACSLYCFSSEIAAHSQSLALTSLLTALETLSEFDARGQKRDPCPECQQARHGVLEKFRAFLETYGMADAEDRKAMQELYGLRSKILHAGKLLLLDLEPLILAGQAAHEQREDLHALRHVTRELLCNWLHARTEPIGR